MDKQQPAGKHRPEENIGLPPGNTDYGMDPYKEEFPALYRYYKSKTKPHRSVQAAKKEARKILAYWTQEKQRTEPSPDEAMFLWPEVINEPDCAGSNELKCKVIYHDITLLACFVTEVNLKALDMNLHPHQAIIEVKPDLNPKEKFNHWNVYKDWYHDITCRIIEFSWSIHDYQDTLDEEMYYFFDKMTVLTPPRPAVFIEIADFVDEDNVKWNKLKAMVRKQQRHWAH